MSSIHVMFPSDDQAERVLVASGFSVGRLQANAPRGILYGAFDIQKWRNLNASDRDGLDGLLRRNGAAGSRAWVTINAADHIPAKAIIDVVEAALERSASPPPDRATPCHPEYPGENRK